MAQDATEIKAALTDVAAMIDAFLRDSLNDPDLAAKSADYRAGYEAGFREAAVAFVTPLAEESST